MLYICFISICTAAAAQVQYNDLLIVSSAVRKRNNKQNVHFTLGTSTNDLICPEVLFCKFLFSAFASFVHKEILALHSLLVYHFMSCVC